MLSKHCSSAKYVQARSLKSEKHLLASSPACLSAHISSASIGRISMKFDIGHFCESLPRKRKFLLKSDENRAVYLKTYTSLRYRRHNFSIKSLLCSTQYFYIVGTVVQRNDTEITHCCLSIVMWLRERPSIFVFFLL